jgi:hypothetical protein
MKEGLNGVAMGGTAASDGSIIFMCDEGTDSVLP